MSEQDPSPLTRSEIRAVISETVDETLIKLGIEPKDAGSMQRDFIFLRELRETHEQIKKRASFVLVGIIITATVGAIWLGISSMFGGKP